MRSQLPLIRTKLPLILAAYPIAWLSMLYLFVLRARFHLGHWPEPYHPDPKDLGFTVHQQAIWIGLMALPVVALATIALALVGRRVAVDRRIWPTVMFLVASIALVMVVARLDPGGFFNWFAD